MTKDQLAQYKKGYRAYNANREIEKQREAESYSRMVQEQNPQPEPDIKLPPLMSTNDFIRQTIENKPLPYNNPNSLYTNTPTEQEKRNIEISNLIKDRNDLSIPLSGMGGIQRGQTWGAYEGTKGSLNPLNNNWESLTPDQKTAMTFAKEKHPWLNMGGELAGFATSLPTKIVGGLGKLASGAIGKAGQALLPKVAQKVAPVVNNPVAKSAASGAFEMGSFGGVSTAADIKREGGNISENLGRIGEAVASNALMGAGLGAGFNLAGQGLSKGFQSVKGIYNKLPSTQLRNIDNAYDTFKTDGIFNAKVSARPTYSNTLQVNKILDDLNVGTRLRNTATRQQPLALKPARVPDSEVIFGNAPSASPRMNMEPLQLPSGQKPLMLKEGTFLQPPVKPVGLGEAPQGKFNVKPFSSTNANSMRSTFEKANIPITRENIILFEKDLQRAMNEAIERQSQILQKDGKRGVESWLQDVRGTIKDNSSGYIRKGGSLNEPWYSQSYKELGGKDISGKDYKMLAEKYLKEGYETSQGAIPPDEYFIGLQKQLDDLNSFKNELGFKNVSDFKPQNKTVEPIKKYAQQMEQYNNPFPQSTRKIETPFKAFPGELKNINVPPKVQNQFSKEMFPKLPNMKNVASKSKTLPVESNLNPIKTNGGINSPSTKLNAPKGTTMQNNMKPLARPQNLKGNEKFSQNSGKFADDIQNKLKDLETEYKKSINNIKNNKIIDPQLKQKQLFAEGQRYSARKRELIQGDSLVKVEGGLTEKELANKINKMKSNYSGKEVITPDGEGISTGQSSFGKVGVKVNGEIKYYPKEQVQGKVNVDDLISQQKQANINPTQQINMREEIAQNLTDDIIPPRQNVNNAADIGTGKMKNRQFIENSYMNSEVIPNKMKTEMKGKIPQYEPLTNKETLNKANTLINDVGYDTAKNNFLSSSKLRNAEDTAIGQSLIQKAIKKGKFDEANDIAISLAEKLTNAGQTVQAASMFKRMTPDGMLRYANKIINEANIKNSSKKGFEKIKLTPEETKFITDSMAELNNKTKNMIVLPIDLQMFANETLAKIFKLIGNKVPADIGQKIRAFQRINLLLNPKTMIRNLSGNVISGGVGNISDILRAGIDKGVSKITKERTALLPSFKEQIKGGKKGFNRVISDFKQDINTAPTGTQYEINQGVNSVSPFKNKTLKSLDKLTTTGLRLADDPFYQGFYDDSLRIQMKLKGVNTPTPEMIKHADQVARERTFQDINYMTKLFSGFQKALNKIGTENFGLGNIVLPFVKTPANILARALEYSPVEIGKGISKALIDAGKGTAFDQYKFVDSLAKGLTGTALIGAGYELAQKGTITGQAPKDKDTRDYLNANGILPYSFKVGDKNYTYDWMQPSSIPLAIGADIYYNLKDKKDAKNTLLSAGSSGLQTLMSQSLLQGLSKLFGSGTYSNTNSIGDSLINTALGAGTQFVPLGSIQRQVAEISDPYKRNLYEDSQVNSYLVNPIKNTIAIPGPRQTLPTKVNSFGNKVEANGLFDTMINPARSAVGSDINPKVNDELIRLYKDSTENKQFPQLAKGTIAYKTSKKSDTQKFKLTPQQLAEYQQTVGQGNSKAIEKVINSNEYRKSNDKQKSELISKAMSEVKQKAENTFLKSQGIKEYKAR